MYKDFFIYLLLAIIFGLLFILLSGSMCNCRCVPYKPYTTTYRAFLA